MPWIGVTLEVEAAQAEAFSDALMEEGAQSVWLEEPAAPRQRLHALLAEQADAPTLLARAAAAAGLALPRYEARAIADEDWVRATQAQFAPLCLEGRLWIVPKAMPGSRRTTAAAGSLGASCQLGTIHRRPSRHSGANCACVARTQSSSAIARAS